MRKSYLYRYLFAAFILLCPADPGLADTIELKTGEKITGIVIERDQDFIKVDFKGAVIVYRVHEINSIDGKPVSGKAGALPSKPLQGLLESSGSPKFAVRTSAVTPAEYMARGYAFYNKGNPDQAIADLTRAIKLIPDYAAAYQYRGLAHAVKNERDEAIADYTRVMEIDPRNEEVYYLRALAYSGQKDLDKALADYAKAIEINPKYVQAYINRSFINVTRGDSRQVVADVQKIIEINPDIAAAYFLRGVAYVGENNMDQAIADYSKAIKLKPDYAEAYINRALAYAFREKVAQSMAGSSSPSTYINTGAETVDIDSADFELAIADCAKAIELNPRNLEAYEVRAKIYMLAKDYDKAGADVRKVEEMGGKVKAGFYEELKAAAAKKEAK